MLNYFGQRFRTAAQLMNDRDARFGRIQRTAHHFAYYSILEPGRAPAEVAVDS
jgi:hypothetical protein